MLLILTILYSQFFQLNYAVQNASNNLESEHLYSRISDKKCKEYQGAIYDLIWIERDVITGELVKLYNQICPHSFDGYIIGGSAANPKEFPHMALIGESIAIPKSKPQWFCGGTLISDEYVLTAAHCLPSDKKVTEYIVRLGELDHTTILDDATHDDFDIIEIFIHPNYTEKETYNDIALFKLSRKVNFTHYIRPACLSTNIKDYNEKYVIGSGWGGTIIGGARQSNILKKVVLEKFVNNDCDLQYKKIRSPGITDKLPNGIQNISQICYGSRVGIGDTCKGDSGGPLQIYHLDKINYSCMYSVIAVTSVSHSACRFNFPGIYTRVDTYLDWIEGIVWQNEKL